MAVKRTVVPSNNRPSQVKRYAGVGRATYLDGQKDHLSLKIAKVRIEKSITVPHSPTSVGSSSVAPDIIIDNLCQYKRLGISRTNGAHDWYNINNGFAHDQFKVWCKPCGAPGFGRILTVGLFNDVRFSSFASPSCVMS
ncbi:unnamed protein product [Fusarium fujikuroi]|nr:unnamed protein product [Fusarium fujikuroi]